MKGFASSNLWLFVLLGNSCTDPILREPVFGCEFTFQDRFYSTVNVGCNSRSTVARENNSSEGWLFGFSATNLSFRVNDDVAYVNSGAVKIVSEKPVTHFEADMETEGYPKAFSGRLKGSCRCF
jgi:hypothetical protein